MDVPLDPPSGPGVSLSDDDLAKLLEVGRTLVAELDVEAVLRRVLDTARELTGARYAALGILDEPKEELERFVFVGIDEKTRRVIGPLPRGAGVLGELIRNPEPLRLADVNAHPHSYGFPPGHPPMTTFLGVPVVVRGAAYGNLYLTEKHGGAEFDERDEEVTIVLAEWASIAIGNARLYEQATHRRTELERVVNGLEATAAVARAAGFDGHPERVLELIVKRGRALVDARCMFVLMAHGGDFRVAAVAGEAGRELVGTVVPRDGTIAGNVAASGEPEQVAQLQERGGHGLEAVADDLAPALVVPLGFRERGRGVLVALGTRQARAFDADQEHLLTSFGASAAIAIAAAESAETERLKLSVRASESERRRWARELHDETLQELGALNFMLQAAQASSQPGALESAVQKALEQLELSIASLQSLITELRPASLDELGVQPALEALAKRTSAYFGVAVETELDFAFAGGRAATRLTDDIESTTYRIVQEAITNAVKHAEADTISVGVAEADETIVITVRDDGSGFDPEARTAGFGLVGMRERVEMVDGRLLIESDPEHGTLVRAELPALHRAPADGVSELLS